MTPADIMPTAYIPPYFTVSFMRSRFRAPKLYAIIGTTPVLRPNIGMKMKLWSLK